MKKSTGYGETRASAPAGSFLQGAGALSFAREFGALVHKGEGPPVTWPYAHQIVEQGADPASMWLAAEPEWPAFALQGAFAAAMSSKKSVRILVPTAECFSIAAGLLLQLTGGAVGFRRHDVGRGLALRVLEGTEPVDIYVEPGAVPVFYGPPWLPADLLQQQDEMPLQMRRCLNELMVRADLSPNRWPGAPSFGWPGEPKGGDEQHKT